MALSSFSKRLLTIINESFRLSDVQISMMKFHNILLACALGAGSLLGAAAPASAAHVSVGTARPAATGRVLPGTPTTEPDTGATAIATATATRIATAIVTATPIATATATVWLRRRRWRWLWLRWRSLRLRWGRLRLRALSGRIWASRILGTSPLLAPLSPRILGTALRSLTYRCHRLNKAVVVRG